MAKMTRAEAQKKLNEIGKSVEEFREKAQAEMIKLADEYDLSFYFAGEGRYYGGELSIRDDYGDDCDWMRPGDWNSSACW
jgi:hypothetical protein